MKIATWIIAGIGILGFLFFAGNQTAEPNVSFSTVSSDMNNGAKLYDVRTVEEFSESYIQGAEHYPLANLQAKLLPDVSKDSKIYVYCRSGNRSAEATQILEQAGFSNVVDLGGLSDVTNIGGTLLAGQQPR